MGFWLVVLLLACAFLFCTRDGRGILWSFAGFIPLIPALLWIIVSGILGFIPFAIILASGLGKARGKKFYGQLVFAPVEWVDTKFYSGRKSQIGD